jgi:serine/threonine-protein kinase
MSSEPEIFIQHIDGIQCRTKEPFDFSFLKEYGKVFKIFDEQNSGCICFGVSDGKNKYFIKFAGVETINNGDTTEFPISDNIDRLKAAVPKYKELVHPLLIRFIESKEIERGYMSVFEWFDGESFSIEIPLIHKKYTALPTDK